MYVEKGCAFRSRTLLATLKTRIALQLNTSMSKTETPPTFNRLGHVIVYNKRDIPGETKNRSVKFEHSIKPGNKRRDDYYVLDINTTTRHISRYKNIFRTRLETRQSKLSVKLRRNENKSTNYPLFCQILMTRLSVRRMNICITGL